MMAAGPIWPGPRTWQGQWHPDRVILGVVQMTCYCGDKWLTNAREQSWDGFAGVQWPCCSWSGTSQTALLQVSWGTLMHWVLLLLCRTTPGERRRRVWLLGLAACTFVSSRARGVCSKWSSEVSGLRGWMGWVPLCRKKNALSNLPPQRPLAAMSSFESSCVVVLRVVKV